MSNQEKLQIVMGGTEWEEAAREMQTWDWQVDAQVDHYASILVGRVLAGKCAVMDLRAGLTWVNALDAEAVKLGVAINVKDVDGTEALARRIAHHAGRSALRDIGTRLKLEATRARKTVNAGYLL
ncbi:MAG TPA: hypothetical protein VLG25_00655 [Patescibacteria group bacterium]|nr:hypothetical protein [Patescibacteria group bacterium]